jgi:hypothetical protein
MKYLIATALLAVMAALAAIVLARPAMAHYRGYPSQDQLNNCKDAWIIHWIANAS